MGNQLLLPEPSPVLRRLLKLNQDIKQEAPVLMDSPTVTGYASLFNKVDSGGDFVLPGAFTASLEQRQSRGQLVRMLVEHNPEVAAGEWTEIYENERGLFVVGRIARNDRKLPRGLSIGYRTKRSRRTPKTGNRELLEIDLWKISLVSMPMMPECQALLQEPGDG